MCRNVLPDWSCGYRSYSVNLISPQSVAVAVNAFILSHLTSTSTTLSPLPMQLSPVTLFGIYSIFSCTLPGVQTLRAYLWQMVMLSLTMTANSQGSSEGLYGSEIHSYSMNVKLIDTMVQWYFLVFFSLSQ